MFVVGGPVVAWPGFAQAAQKAGSGSGGAGTSSVGGVDFRRAPTHLGTNATPSTGTTGINGTAIGHIAGPGSVGGPAKDRSGINGTALRRKF